jgi:hypothetical protein
MVLQSLLFEAKPAIEKGIIGDAAREYGLFAKVRRFVDRMALKSPHFDGSVPFL